MVSHVLVILLYTVMWAIVYFLGDCSFLTSCLFYLGVVYLYVFGSKFEFLRDLDKRKTQWLSIMNNSKISGVVCCWEFHATDDKYRSCKLAEYFVCTEDNFTFQDAVNSWRKWISKEKGRIVTSWSFDAGVCLLCFNPPTESPWLSIEFIQKISELPNWWTFLHNGYELHLGTVKVAKQEIFG